MIRLNGFIFSRFWASECSKFIFIFYENRWWFIEDIEYFNPLSANPTKWPNTLKQFVGNLPTNCLSAFDHFLKLVLKGLTQVKTCLTSINNSSNLFCQKSWSQMFGWDINTPLRYSIDPLSSIYLTESGVTCFLEWCFLEPFTKPIKKQYIFPCLTGGG